MRRWQLVGVVAGIFVALAWAAARSGFTMAVGAGDQLAAAKVWPDRAEAWYLQFYADSPLFILFGRLTGIDSSIGMVRQGLLVALIGLGLLAAWAWWLTGNADGPRAVRLVLLAPISAVLFASVGSYDAFTAATWGLALWLWTTKSRGLTVLGGVLLGIQHFEHALLGAVALLFTWLALRSDLPPRLGAVNPVWVALGVVIGKAGLIAYLVASGSTPTARVEWLFRYVGDWTKNGLATAPSLLWSLFAGLWMLVILMWLRGEKRARLLLVAALGVGLLGTAVSGDRPRVFILVLLPSVMIAITQYLRDERPSRVERQSVEALVWVGPPLILGGKMVTNTNVIDNAYVTFMWVTGLG